MNNYSEELRHLLIEALGGDPAYEFGTDLCVRMIVAIRRGGPLPPDMESWAAHMESLKKEM